MRATRLALLLPVAALLAAGCATSDSGEASRTTRGGTAVAPGSTDPASDTASLATAKGRSARFDRGDHVTFVRDGRLWVFDRGSETLEEFLRTGEPAESTTAVGAGPAGMSVRSGDAETIVAYLAHRDGFHVAVEGNVVWVFPIGSEELAGYLRDGEPAESYTLVGAAPKGRSLRSADRSAVLEYLTAKPGFVTIGDEGRVWIFREGSEALEEYRRVGEPPESITMIGAGPNDTTLRSTDRETILEWMTAKPGFVTVGDEGRLWIFEEGSEALAEFRRVGEPGRSVTMIGAGPRNTTLRAVDRETILRWQGTAEGFDVFVRDGRLWVFDADSEGSREFRRTGEPAKRITRIGVGPAGATVCSDDADTLNRYLRSIS